MSPDMKNLLAYFDIQVSLKLIFLSTAIFSIPMLSGCAAGKSSGFSPSITAVHCTDDTSMQFLFAPIEGTTVFHMGIPLGYQQWDHTKDQINVQIYFATKFDSIDIPSNSVAIYFPDMDKEYPANSISIKSFVQHDGMTFQLYDVFFPGSFENVSGLLPL